MATLRTSSTKKLILASFILIGASSVTSFLSGAESLTCNTVDSFTVEENAVSGHSSCATSALIPNSVTSTVDNALSDATSLEPITTPNSVTPTVDNALSDAASLEPTTIPNSVTPTVGKAPTAVAKIFESSGAGLVEFSRARETRFVGSIGNPWIEVILLAPKVDHIFDAQGGIGVATISANQPFNLPSTTRSGFTLANWNTAADGLGTAYLAGAMFTPDVQITFYAQWTPDSYIISYNANSSTGGTVPADQTKTHAIDLTLATNSGTLVRTGYTFDGWNTAADGLGTSYAVSSIYSLNAADELFAKWSADDLDVTWDSQGGSTVTATTVATGEQLAAPAAPTWTGYIFDGWSATSTGSIISFPYTHGQTIDFTLYAIWSADDLDGTTYTVSYNANSATSGTAPANQSEILSVELTLATNSGTLLKDGYTFDGWNTAADGNGTQHDVGSTYTAHASAGLFAKWTLIVLPTVEDTPGPGLPDTNAPTSTPPTERVSAPEGSVEGSNETLEVTSNAEDGSMLIEGQGWNLGVTSNSDSQTTNEDQRLVFQPETQVEIAAAGLMPESTVAFWLFTQIKTELLGARLMSGSEADVSLFSEQFYLGGARTDSAGGFFANFELPDGVAAGEHTLQVLSRDSSGRAITLNFPITLNEKVVQKVNAGSFKGYVAIYAKGYEGQRLSAKVGKDWVVVPSIPRAKNNLYRYVEYVGAGVDCAVRIYVDRVLIDTINLTTR